MTESELRALWLANLLQERHVYKLPVNPLRIARAYGIRVRTASAFIGAGVDERELFEVWGNRDGCAMAAGRDFLICYNDRQPKNRQRFTAAEELCHILLGHVRDERFAIGTQGFDREIYAEYEHEAKTAAGLLLFPASTYLRLRYAYPLRELAWACRISEDCASTTAVFIDKNEAELREKACGRIFDVGFDYMHRKKVSAIRVSMGRRELFCGE